MPGSQESMEFSPARRSVGQSQSANRGRPTNAGAAEPTAAQYAAENAALMAAWSDYFEKAGLPLVEYRQF